MARSRRGRRDLGLVGIFAAGVQVFRFYPDGTVLDVLVKPPPDTRDAVAIDRWLRPGEAPAGVHTTRYTRRGHRISFTTRSHLGGAPISVSGTWSKGALRLTLTGDGRTGTQTPFRRLDDGGPES
ncbi:hypothetical protein ACFXKD_31170 [Nocardiopsis aegyptia]|uniref:hypothetical protein n=1 Tax=Nocardiopsis aegyptia TaxID=220378 RepID=UPI00367043D0